MWKKILVAGSVGAAILGVGGVALASTDGSSPSPSPTTSTSTTASGKVGAHAGRKAHRRDELRTALHGQITTRGKDGFVTHDGIRGTVTAVSTTSITVKAADGTVETYVIDGQTITHLKADGKQRGTAAEIAKVETGDSVGVLGTGTTTLTATHVIDTTR
jgi:hypothetical protein